MRKPKRVVDSHVHFWDPAVLHYPWIEAVPALRRAFVPGDLESTDADSIDAFIFVEANCLGTESLAEVEFVEGLAGAESRILGMVAHVDMLDEDGRTHALDALSRHGSVAGVRHNIQGHEQGYCLEPAFVRGVKEAGLRGFTFDLCITAEQLPDATQLALLCPEVQFILDHCGKPAIRDDSLEAWALGLFQLAQCPNVVCKVSGLLTEARADQQSLEALRPYLEEAHISFGVERLLFGSDWPVVTLAGSMDSWRGVVDAFTESWSGEDRDAFYAGNAIRTYGLGGR
ncbi:MAG: amidohydrolase family protein [Gemmatimonadota bacterium]|nr:amidohydrolase family protein [Gemmatimonadota bacterium]